MVLFANQIIDPQWNWPMDSNLFNDYIIDKYTSDTANSLNISANTVTYSQVLAYTQGNIKNYVKTVTTTDTYSSTSNTSIYVIDQTAYNNVIQTTTTANFPSGASVIQNVAKYTQSLYDYEVQQNESRRSINLVNSKYVPQFEAQFKALMK
jgi:RecA/RadA recombinase